MIRNLIRGVLFAAVLMMASSCALFRSGDRIRLTEKDSGRTLETEVGDVIEIRLPGQPVHRISLEREGSRDGGVPGGGKPV